MTAQTADAGSNERGLRVPIRLRFSAFVGGLLVLSTILLSVAAFVVAREMLYEQIDSRLSVVAADRQRLLLAYINQQHERVALVASRTRLRQLAQSYLQKELTNEEFLPQSQTILVDALQSTAGFNAIWLTDLDGRVLTATDDMYLGTNYSRNEDFLAGREGPHLGRPFAANGTWHAFATAQATASDGTLLGVVMVLMDASPMVEFLSATNNLGASGEVLVGAPENDKVHFLLPPRHDRSVVVRSLDTEPAMAAAVRGQIDFIHTTDYRGADVLAACRPVGYLNWGIVVKIDTDEAYEPVARLGRLMLFIAAGILLAGLIASYIVARALTSRILRLTRTVVSAGDDHDESTAVDQAAVNDEIGDLTLAFDAMTSKLRQQRDCLREQYELERASRANVEQLTTELEVALDAEKRSRQRMERLLGTIHEAAIQLGSSVTQISANMSRHGDSARRHAVAIAETSTTVAEVTQSAQQAAERAQGVAERAKRAENVSKIGRESVRDSVAAIQEVRTQMDAASENIHALAELAHAVGAVIDSITDIADQTNLLALNAAVEASRSGEHGKGFAVVAAEVKTLANLSKTATHKIQQILRDIQQAVNTAVIQTELGAKSVNRADDIVRKTEGTIETLSTTISEAARAGTQILAGAHQQSVAISQINAAMVDIRQATDQALAATRETEKSAEDLAGLGERLRELSDNALSAD